MKKKTLLALLLFAPAGIFIAINSSRDILSIRQKQAAVENLLGRKTKVSSNKTSSGDYRGKYFSLIYPTSANIYDNTDQDSIRIDNTFPKWTFVATAASVVNNQTLEEMPGVAFRKSKSSIYTQTYGFLDSHKTISFTKDQDGSEKSTSAVVSGKIYNFVISSVSSSLSDIEPVFDKIISSVSLHE